VFSPIEAAKLKLFERLSEEIRIQIHGVLL
jgi:hypothetical protein